MDTVTQITLGAAVGEATGGRDAGAKGPLWGAALGLLPDLDVLANPFLTELQALTLHRSVTHSLVFIVAVSLAVAFGLRRLHPDTPVSASKWGVLAILALGTHVGLDCLTTYGTQVFWPFSNYPVIYGTIFIIDPLYTVPLAAGLLIGFRWAPPVRARRFANYVGLALSSAYLLFTLINKAYVESVFQDALRAQDLPHEQVFTKPTAFNNLLWTAVAEGEDGFHVGFYSLLDEDQTVDFRYVPKRHDLLGDAADSPFVERLRWFSRGYFIVREPEPGMLTVQDLRFGRSDLGLTRDGKYIFTFVLDRNEEGTITGFQQRRPDMNVRWPLLRRFVARIGGHPLRLETTRSAPGRNNSVNGDAHSR